MHYKLLVTFDKEYAKNSQEAREYVSSQLTNDPSFVSGDDYHRFSSPICDWFVIGGRWSGELSNKTWAKKIVKKIEALEKKEDVEIAGCFYSQDKKTDIQTRVRAEAEKMYREAMPSKWQGKGLTFDRFTNKGNYEENGFEDDAMIVSEELYELLKEYEVEAQDEELHFVDLDDEEVSKDFIGRKWLVVVDYHN